MKVLQGPSGSPAGGHGGSFAVAELLQTELLSSQRCAVLLLDSEARRTEVWQAALCMGFASGSF